MTEKSLPGIKKQNEKERTDFNMLLARILLEKYPELGDGLANGAKQFKKFIDDPKTQDIAKHVVLNAQKLIKSVSDAAFLEGVANFIKLPEKRRQAILSMSEWGWYPFEECIRSIPLTIDSIDGFMVDVLDKNYEKIKTKILEKYSERRNILECAFRLIEEGNDIAVIPLLLTQIDGISKDLFGMYYFTQTRMPFKKESFPAHLKSKGDGIGDIYDLLRAVIDNANKALISDGFEKLNGEVNPINILNRSGILHGDKNFINYWEKPNTYKVLSLLLYVDWISEFVEEEQII